MGKIKELSVDLRQKIINFHKSGNSYRTISNRLAIPRSTVQSIVKKSKRFDTTENLPGRGRKPKLSPKNVRKRCHKVNINPSVVSKDIDKSLNTKGISVSTHIILRCLNWNGLYGNRPQPTPLHKLFHFVAWFSFAKTFLDKENCF